MNFPLMTCDLGSEDELLTVFDNILTVMNWTIYVISQ